MLPNHFILHAKSLARLALRAPPNPEAGFRPVPSQAEVIANFEGPFKKRLSKCRLKQV